MLFLNILGALFLVAAVVLVFTIPKLEVGQRSARFIALLCAAIGYYYVAAHIPFLQVNPQITAAKWLVPLMMAGIAIYHLVGIVRHWEEEFKFIVENSPKVIGIVVLATISRFLLGL